MKQEVIKDFYGKISGKVANPMKGELLNVGRHLLLCVNNKVLRTVKQIFIEHIIVTCITAEGSV
jgi:hypothetical protein